jgi:DNA-binding CsgD family transcriptional regulator
LKRFPKLNIAAVSIGEFPDSLAVWFIWRRVKSYVNFSDGIEEFYHGLEEIRDGRSYISAGVQRLMEDAPEWPQTFDKLTKRQMEVLILICNGFIAESIGAALHISRAMVNSHLDRLYKTFHVTNREELIKTAFGLKLVTDKDLVFYDRDRKTGVLPEWAEIRKKMNRKQGGIKNEELRIKNEELGVRSEKVRRFVW